MHRLRIFATLIGMGMAILAACPAAQAGITVFEDDFDSYADPGEWIRMWEGGGTWTVGSGTVDLIGGDSEYEYFSGQGYGHYVDMDGSSFDAGQMLQTNPVLLGPGTYRLSFDLAGNHRVNSSDQVEVEVQVGLLGAETYTLQRNDPFTTYSRKFTVSTATNAWLRFEGTGGDKNGALLDNVKLELIPAPAAMLLVAVGLGMVNWLRRRLV